MRNWKYGTINLNFGDYIESITITLEDDMQVLIWGIINYEGQRSTCKWRPERLEAIQGLDFTLLVGETIGEVQIFEDYLVVNFVSGRWFSWDCSI